MKLINADLVVHWEAYDDEHESFTRHSDTIAEFLDQMTDEGCPETVDAVPVRHGRWNCSDDVYETAICSCCGWDTTEPWVHIKEWFQFCPHCGADMRKDGGDG